MITSSGTTGTISILPKDKLGATDGMELWKICLFQNFGQEPTDKELNPNVDVIWPNFASGKLGHLRIAQMIKQGFTGGDESKFHPLYPGSVETDLMFLASKMRAAAIPRRTRPVGNRPSAGGTQRRVHRHAAAPAPGTGRLLHQDRQKLRAKGFS